MKSFGSLYVGSLQYYHRHFLPIIEKGWTQETDRPFRKGNCFVIRLPFTHPGFYIGKWVKGTSIGDWDDESIDKAIFDAMVSREAWKPEDGAYDEFFKD